MLSAIILVPTHPINQRHPFGPLLRTLAALVPTTIEGTVRDVTLLSVGQSADAVNIADEAGCRIVQASDFAGGLGRCLAEARTPWICFLQPGTIPGATFGEDVAAALDEAAEPPRALLLRSGGGGLARYIPALSMIVGVIAPKDRLHAGGCASFADVLRRARPARSLASGVAFL